MNWINAVATKPAYLDGQTYSAIVLTYNVAGEYRTARWGIGASGAVGWFDPYQDGMYVPIAIWWCDIDEISSSSTSGT